MLAAAAIAAGMWPKRNKWAVNKQRYGCMSTEDFAFFCPRERAVSHRQLAIEFRQWRWQGVTTGLVLLLVTVPLS